QLAQRLPAGPFAAPNVTTDGTDLTQKQQAQHLRAHRRDPRLLINSRTCLSALPQLPIVLSFPIPSQPIKADRPLLKPRDTADRRTVSRGGPGCVPVCSARPVHAAE